MSLEEIKEAQLRQDRVQVRMLADPTVEALDALRQAVVAQTTLLRSISEQVRLGQAATNGALDGLASTIGHFHGDTGEALAGLAERLEKLDKQDDRFLVALEQVAGGHNVRLDKLASWLEAIQHRQGAIEAKLTPQSEIRFNDGSVRSGLYGGRPFCRKCGKFIKRGQLFTTIPNGELEHTLKCKAKPARRKAKR